MCASTQPRSESARAEGKLDEAEAAGRKGVELQPTAAGCRRWQVFVAIERSNGAAALREAQLEPNKGYRRFELALAHYARGDRHAADAAFAELIAKDRNFLAYQIAEVYAWRGEMDEAFEWLQIAFDQHDTGILSLLIDPLMRGLHHGTRYKDLLAKIGLPLSIGSSQTNLPRMRENQIPLSRHGSAIDRPIVFDCKYDSDRNHLRLDRFAVRF
jgi:tetratricopeptide (TPR) repeat protein